MRPIASHAAVSGVGKHTARESEAPNVVRMGKSAWRAPTPDIGPGTSVPGPLSLVNTLCQRVGPSFMPGTGFSPGPAR